MHNNIIFITINRNNIPKLMSLYLKIRGAKNLGKCVFGEFYRKIILIHQFIHKNCGKLILRKNG